MVLTAIGVRLWLRFYMKREPPRTGHLVMPPSSFGDAAETRRDVCRTYAAGCILLAIDGEEPTVLRPPPSLTPGVDKEAVEKQLSAFSASLK